MNPVARFYTDQAADCLAQAREVRRQLHATPDRPDAAGVRAIIAVQVAMARKYTHRAIRARRDMPDRCITTRRIDPADVPASDIGVAALRPGAIAYRVTDTGEPNTTYAVAVPESFRVGITTGGDAVWIDDVPPGAVLDIVADHLAQEEVARHA